MREREKKGFGDYKDKLARGKEEIENSGERNRPRIKRRTGERCYQGSRNRELRSEVVGDEEIGRAPARLRTRVFFFSSRRPKEAFLGIFGLSDD